MHVTLSDRILRCQQVNDCDPQFSQSHYSFFVSEARLKSNAVVGEIKVSGLRDGDLQL